MIQSLVSWVPHSLTMSLLPLPLIYVMTASAEREESTEDGIYPGEGWGEIPLWFSWEEYALDPVWEAEEKRLRNT